MDDSQKKKFDAAPGKQLLAAIILLTVAIATFGCSGITDTPAKLESQAKATTTCGVEEMLLLVVEESGRRIPGAQVTLVNPAGPRRLGETGDFGEICVARSEFDSSVEEYLMFCREGYFCGIFDVQKDVARFDERIIALARVVLR